MNQKCIVTNKAQLLAAVNCAFDFEGDTEIILNREGGTTIFKFWCHSYYTHYHKYLRKVRAQIKRTPAECFR